MKAFFVKNYLWIIILLILVLGIRECSKSNDQEKKENINNEEPATTDKTEEPEEEKFTFGDSEDESFSDVRRKQETNDNQPTWRFEGRVMDLLRYKPISSATLVFSGKSTNKAKPYEVQTDGFGNYQIVVPSLKKQAYRVQIQHPDYLSRTHWGPDALRKPKKERYRLGAGALKYASNSKMYRGQDNIAKKLDFYLFPLQLTEQEEQESGGIFNKSP